MIRQQKSYFHRGGDIPLLGNTIAEHFAQIVQHYPNHEAVVSLPQERRLTYRELAVRVDQLARGQIPVLTASLPIFTVSRGS